MVINTYGWTKFTVHLLFLRKCVSLCFVSFPQETNSGAERLGDFICISLSASYALLATGSVILWCPSLVIKLCMIHKLCYPSMLAVELHQWGNVTVHTDVWLASMIWFWVVFYAPAITSVASLVPRPPFNTARGSGNETTCWLVSFYYRSWSPKRRRRGRGTEMHVRLARFAIWITPTHPHPPTHTWSTVPSVLHLANSNTQTF